MFEDLVKRGLTGVAYVVSDEHAGLVQAARRFLPNAASFLRLGTALAVERNEQWLARRYVPARSAAEGFSQAAYFA